MATIPHQAPSSSEPQPAWNLALLFPYQGEWSDDDYLSLNTNQLVELVDGNLEVLPVPTIYHQMILSFLYDVLKDYVTSENLGTVLFAPLPLRIRPKTIREPDLMFIARKHDARLKDKYLSVADLVMEVVSPDDESHARDYKKKRADYATKGIPEYWIVDPQLELITVLILDGNQYQLHGEFTSGEQATSVLLDGFTVDISAVFAAAKNS